MVRGENAVLTWEALSMVLLGIVSPPSAVTDIP